MFIFRSYHDQVHALAVAIEFIATVGLAIVVLKIHESLQYDASDETQALVHTEHSIFIAFLILFLIGMLLRMSTHIVRDRSGT